VTGWPRKTNLIEVTIDVRKDGVVPANG